MTETSVSVLHEIEMTAQADDGLALAGTLTLPAGPGPHPAVLCLPGSGRIDRDSNAGRLRMNLGRPLATTLAQHGIASLRYDRRGVGATQGDWREVGFLDNRADAAAALRAMRAHPEIRPHAVGVLGHSEGAVHAAWLAAHTDISAVVLLAGYARPGEEAVQWQLAQLADSLPRMVRPLLRRFAARQLTRLKAADTTRVAGMRINAQWWREQLAYDPRPDLARINTPALAITGEKDIQVDPADLEVIANLAKAEVRRIPDLTHVLRRDPGPASMRSYRRLLSEPVDAALLTNVTQWLLTQLR
ncbi:pimeloyl-ACP methyl ester carboxylesterase [Kibdelosporangium banguiense]|uniref:Pimeloyl-ACP methyl ester carboxylesterase n=1 Tax=Kibdelosporangium banguiense TaxID=1365924 RepID=A0ABS4TKN0_9PSEU|nr:alpha/beta hydrolase [Kibdelosporangium banguiense]MBP2324982.1 pimeloyl-ACP methyl ester carboxylesterase [Kibdelosporangium banguiense]